ncbi:MAG: glycogen/starch/alpha-glucan phosphorylase [Lachnospiraceae bacterium]|nr:glycogen/starch/alpha-glucan phosphorylase [Lachnospiraceae bacterium]
MTITNTRDMERALVDKLMIHFGKPAEAASNTEMVKACALVIRDQMAIREVETKIKTMKEQKKQVHYLSLEFLIGRSLMKNAFNLGVLQQLKEALENLGFNASDIFETEPDAALGNGGLGRLAACYLESMTTLEIPATGYSICYELGIFKQKIIDGQQVELPDNWRSIGDAWLLPKPEESEQVQFEGEVHQYWENGKARIVLENATKITAVPCDMIIAGYDTRHTNVLRLWDAKSSKPVDMSFYSRGEYVKAVEEQAMAESIAKVLYPEDKHYEGKSLRMKQQYFFVSATVQSIVRKHLRTYGTLKNFHEKNAIQINDTHPTLVIPELMRLFMDEHGMEWDEAWDITTKSVAYTNHTVMWEALERWPQTLISSLLPRIWQIITEIARRWQEQCQNYYHDEAKVRELAIIWDGEVRMANLCVAGGMAVNGVSGLHSDILKHDVFKYFYQMNPEKFQNVTNGIDHRRWLAEINPGLADLIKEKVGNNKYLTKYHELKKLDKFKNDKDVLDRLEKIKLENKKNFAEYMYKEQGLILDPNSIFDVQAKRLHEYKRQLLNVMHIIYIYQRLHDDHDFLKTPETFLFGAKAAPGYDVAKRIIRLINSLAEAIDNDPVCKGRLKVAFMENYRVSLAEHLMPAAEVSEQISTAGKEASGTGNMKFMINGALTIGTLDGANVEMHDVLGDENMFLFGLHADEVVAMKRNGYNPQRYYSQDDRIRAVLDNIRRGFGDGERYEDIYNRLLMGVGGSSADDFMLLADFDSYTEAHRQMAETYLDRRKWNEMSLHNIARADIFAADRAIAQYADNIWHVDHK